MEETHHEVKTLNDLFGKYSMPGSNSDEGKSRTNSERSELVRYFYENARIAWYGKQPLKPGYIGMKLAHLTVRDLYAFKSMCEDRKRTGYPWGKYFWGSLKAR